MLLILIILGLVGLALQAFSVNIGRFQPGWAGLLILAIVANLGTLHG